MVRVETRVGWTISSHHLLLVRSRRQDAKFWESMFHNRSYLNVSHIQEGARSAIHTAQQTTKQKYNGAKETASKYYREQRQVVEKVSEPYVNKSRVMYEAHMRKHVDLAVETARPHIAPVVDKAMQASREGMALLRNTLDDIFNALVEIHKGACTKALKLAHRPGHKMIREGCRRPQEAVSTGLKALGVIVLLLFRRLIWKILVRTIRSVVGIIWFFSPLRLVLGLFSSRSPPPLANKAPRGNKAKISKKK